jgi:eukaryotic-like serine/threonine-protein kinase
LSSDVYAVATSGIQALTGIHPRDLPKDPDNLNIIWRDRTNISPQLANILDRMVDENFRLRYPSAVEALDTIARSPILYVARHCLAPTHFCIIFWKH